MIRHERPLGRGAFRGGVPTIALSVPLLLGPWPPCPEPATRSCTCLPAPAPTTVAEAAAALQQRDALFVARVRAVAFRDDSLPTPNVAWSTGWFRHSTLVATVTVGRVWKGALPDTVRVETPAATTMCGADLRVGLEYLIDASPVAGPAFYTTKCSWTRRWHERDPLGALLDAASARGGRHRA